LEEIVTQKYTDDEVRVDLVALSLFLQDKFKNDDPNAPVGEFWSVVTRISWAASQYLEAKKVLEWYANEENHGLPAKLTRTGMESLSTPVQDDQGQRAREFLEGK
jgi:hypothetical protein